jgi:endonuclease/exonuclease/phosphatase family metal-dependent hydrolase
MSESLDKIPDSIKGEFDRLNSALSAQIPARDGSNILIATWNIRKFGNLTRSWDARDKSPKRDFRALRYIIEIFNRFDVIAVQEVTGNLRALRDTMKFLGGDWSFLMTDITKGAKGNKERLAFVFNNRRLRLSGLACEIVIPPEWTPKIQSENALSTQFARTPYAVSFLSGDKTFILLTAHINYGDKPEDRVEELRWIAKWMYEWAHETNDYSQNLILLGDFNIDRIDSPLWKAFTETGLYVPDGLNRVKRSIFIDEGEDPRLDKYYDQIAWFKKSSKKKLLTLEMDSCGGFDFLPYIYKDNDLTRNEISHRISDHYPLWCCFSKG